MGIKFRTTDVMDGEVARFTQVTVTDRTQKKSFPTLIPNSHIEYSFLTLFPELHSSFIAKTHF